MNEPRRDLLPDKYRYFSAHVRVMIGECAIHAATLSYAEVFKRKFITSATVRAVKSVLNKGVMCFDFRILAGNCSVCVCLIVKQWFH